jgi:ankyrin repeat protein
MEALLAKHFPSGNSMRNDQATVHRATDFTNSCLCIAAKHGLDHAIKVLLFVNASPNASHMGMIEPADEWQVRGSIPLFTDTDNMATIGVESFERRSQTSGKRKELVQLGRWNVRESDTIEPEHGATRRLNTREMEHHVPSANPRQKQTTIGASENQHKKTALCYAVENGHTSTVELLLRCRANIHSRVRYGWTPLHCAARYGHIDLVRILLKSDDSAPVFDILGRTPLHDACRNGHQSVVAILLLEPIAYPYLQDTDGLYPLEYAAMYGHTSVVELFLNYAMRKGIFQESNWNHFYRLQEAFSRALHYAAECGYISMAQLLVSYKKKLRF